jgi:hypothetical protein
MRPKRVNYRVALNPLKFEAQAAVSWAISRREAAVAAVEAARAWARRGSSAASVEFALTSRAAAEHAPSASCATPARSAAHDDNGPVASPHASSTRSLAISQTRSGTSAAFAIACARSDSSPCPPRAARSSREARTNAISFDTDSPEARALMLCASAALAECPACAPRPPPARRLERPSRPQRPLPRERQAQSRELPHRG